MLPEESDLPAPPTPEDNPDDQLVGEGSGWGGLPDIERNEDTAPAEGEEVRPESARCAFCCGCFLIIFLLFGSGGGYAYYRYRESRSDPLVNLFSDEGYTVQRGSVITIDKPCTTRTLFLARQVIIMAPQKVDIAVRADLCEVGAKLEGKLYIKSKMLTIQKGASVAELEGETETYNAYGEVILNHLHYKAKNNPL